MTEATKAVLFNGVPLLVLAAAYAAVSGAVLPALWRERARAHSLDWGVALVFPAFAISAGIFGVLVLQQKRPFGGHVWLSFAAALVALAPAGLLVVRWRDRAVLGGMGRALDAEERASVRDRELEAVGEISAAVSRARDAVGVARPLVRDVASLFQVGFTGVVVLTEDGAEASGLYAEADGEEAGWWSEVRVDIGHEPSGIASAVFDAAPVTVYDVSSSPLVSPRLAKQVRAQSGAWIPMIAESRVVGVLVLASTDAKRTFGPDELSLLQTLSAEAALALERLRSEAALSDALRREQRAAEIVRRIRAELEPQEVVRVARDELRSTLRLDRIEIDVEAGEARVLAERAVPLGPGEELLVETVGYEIGAALRTAALLEENRRRLEQQKALLHAAQVVTGELELEPVLNRLVEEVTKLLDADAADCYLLDRGRNVLRCAAVHGLDPELVGFEFTPEQGVAGAAIVAAPPVSVGDYATIAAPVPSSAYDGFSRALVAPMVWAGETLGVIGVGIRDASRTFGPDDEELLDAFASLASLALRNAESFAERSRQARIQLAFYRIASLLGEPLSLEQTYDAAAQAAAEALGGNVAAVLAEGPAGLAVVGGHRLPDAVRSLPVPRALADALEDGQILAASQLAADDRFDTAWASAPFTSLLAIPIQGDGTWIVLVLFEEERDFARDDLELAQHVAGAARGAFERSRLFEAERRARGLSQQLARTGSLLATELDPAAVLEAVVAEASELLRADAAALSELENDELTVIAAVGEESEHALGVRSAVEGWTAGEVVHSRAPVARADVRRDDADRTRDAFVAHGHAAYLGVPFAAREGALLGVLSVYSKEPRAWREEEVQALVALAANASVALTNAELYQRVAVEREQSVAILANIADGIVAVDRDGQVVLWNRAAAEITGVPAAEAIGRRPEQVLQRNLESEAGGTNRLVAIPRGDDDVWLSLSEAVMRDPAGAVAGRIFAFRDISAEHAVEQMKSDFVSTVSVELRTPLTSIYGFAQTLLRDDISFEDHERRTFLDFIARESERLTTTVDMLLNVARIDTGDLAVSLEPTDVGAVVRDVVTTAAASGNGHRFVAEVGGEGCTAQADPDKLRQVLDQLISNAVKYSPGGGTVTVSASANTEGVEIAVADEGIGIPASERDRIFSKFYKAGTGAGTGLGLFIAQGLVREMGGRMWVESEEGAGSRFAFELPAALDVTFSTWEA